jgi:hypothetical protein
MVGRTSDAHRAATEALRHFAQVGDLSGIVLLLDDFAELARQEGDLDRAARLSAVAEAHQRATGTSLAGVLIRQTGRAGRAGLNEGPTAKAWIEGSSMTLEQAIEYALQPAGQPSA